MSNTKNSNCTNWLENSISNEHIKYFRYSDFKNIRQIGSGAFGNVFRADWKNADVVFALKTFNNQKSTLVEVVNELKLHRNAQFHPNILKFCGVTKADLIHRPNNYILVLEYADSGTLNSYLNEHFNELGWNDKFKLALQLASAILYLHECGIIHRDLHANNVLVHQKTIKLADFGLSKKIAEASNNVSEIFGVIPYIDPKNFNNRKNYKLNKKSDVYSIGVIMWQISSGYRPFYSSKYDLDLVSFIQGGKREQIIDGTPVEYSNLYTKCWKYEPDERPNMQDVVSTLKILYENDNMNEEGQNPLPISHNSDSGSSRNTINNSSLYNMVLPTNEQYESNSSSIYETGRVGYESNSPSIYETDRVGYESNSSSISNKENSLELAWDKINNIAVDKLIDTIIKEHDRGITFDQIQQQLNQDTDKLITWLLKYQHKAKYIWFLGLFYYCNVDGEENSNNKAFQLFSIASENNFPLAQVYRAKCYSDGYGTEQNKCQAFKLYEKSVENGSIAGQFYLGCCYEYGIGVEKDEEKAAHLYEEAMNSGNITAKLYLANCYRLGKGVDKDETKAFRYYKDLATSHHKIDDAQQQLGNCLYYGIGTKVDKDLAYYWYKKATKGGNIIAKNILKKKKIKIETDKTKNINKKIFSKKLSQLGTYYVGKILIKASYERSFYYFQKAANNGNRVAQFNLGNCYRIGEGVKKDERKAFELFKKSAEQDYIDGKFRLGYCYDMGIGTDINKAKAIELYKIAANEGSSGAQNNLGILYENGDGIERDLEKAIYWYKKAAEVDNEVAQYNLGRCYENELGVKKDEAFKFYKKSAEQGNINAYYKVAYCYDEGIGVDINKEKAFGLYREAAEKGNQFAQSTLGILYESGVDTEKNLRTAFYWYNKAAEDGNRVELYNLGRCYEDRMGTLNFYNMLIC